MSDASSDTPSVQPTRARIWALLVLLTGLGLGLRLWGIGFLLPHDLEGDARILYQMRVLRGAHPDGEQDKHYGQYPLLLAYLERLAPGWRSTEPELPPTASPEEHRERAAAFALRGRRWIAVLATGLIPLTFLLARTFLGAWAALGAAAFVAVSPLHLSYSQQVRPHAASAAFVVLAVLLAIRLARRRGLVAWLGAGLGCALSLAALQSGVASLFPLAAAALVRLRRDGRRVLPFCGLALALVALAVPLFYPFFFSPSSDSGAAQLEWEDGHLLQSGHVIQPEAFRGGGFLRLASIAWNYEPWLALALAAGLVLGLTRGRSLWRATRTPERMVALAYCLPYFCVLGLYDRTVARFCTPLVPFAAILASGTLAWLGTALVRRARGLRAAVLATLPFLLFWLPALASGARQSWLRAQPDTESLTARWIEEHCDAEEDRIATFLRVQLPLFRRIGAPPPNGTAWPMSWSLYEPAHRDEVPQSARWKLWTFADASPAHMQVAKSDPGRFLIGFPVDRIVLQTMREPGVAAWHNRLTENVRKHRERLVRISPDQDPELTDAYLHYDDPNRFVVTPNRTWRLWHARCFGPVIEIYRYRD